MIASLLMALSIANQALFPHPALFAEQHTAVWARAYERALYAEMRHNLEQERAKVEEAQADMAEPLTEAAFERVPEAQDTSSTEIPHETELVAETEWENCGETVSTYATEEVVTKVTPLYSVDGYVPNTDLQTYLYNRLCEQGIPYFMPYAVCLIAQESTWNPLAQNPNGRDKGLLQYRVEYYPGLDWSNPYAEIDLFAAQMGNRARVGKTVSEMISAHNQSDYGPYCQSYVDAVMQHANTLAQIR